MSRSAPLSRPVESQELCAALGEVLESRITGIRRRPCPYQSTYLLEEIEVSLADGAQRTLMFKNLGPEGTAEPNAKPAFVVNPRREIGAYERLLQPLNMGTPVYYGSVIDERIKRYWLFIEKVNGAELYTLGELETWCAVARWLAAFHERSADLPGKLANAVPLQNYTGDYCNLWMERAERFFAGSDLSVVARKYERAVNRIGAMYTTLIHGEFYASNILIDSSLDPLRVCPVDWEMAGIGPAVMDLAALTAGRWTSAERESIVQAYVSHRSGLDRGNSLADFVQDFQCCRLHVAIQWLGWFGKRETHEPHRQDWLGEAFRLAETLD